MKSRIKAKILVVLTVVIVMFSLGGCSNEKNTSSDVASGNITTDKVKEKLDDDSWVFVDTRINDAYNGWALDGTKRGGHIPGAVDFAYDWLDVKNKNKDKILDDALKTKHIDKDKNIVLYDTNDKDAQRVAKYLSNKGYEKLYTYNATEWLNDEQYPVDRYKNYQMIVPASVVHDILNGKTPPTFEGASNVKIVEASWGDETTSYAKGHIPTAFHINTDVIEPPTTTEPIEWLLADNNTLNKFALDYGFTKDDTVIVTGENQMASYRVAVALRYMGVDDVRVLNGGVDAYKRAGYELEKESHKPVPVTDFKANIPQRDYLVDTEDEVKAGLENPNEFMLVDNRTWDEYIGKISGYSYHDKKGHIPGAVFGYAGTTDSNSLEYYRNIDNTMRNGYEIENMLKDAGVDFNKHLSFMCGSGWRVSEILTYANVMGIDNAAIYSDGWIGWSNNPQNPIEVSESKK